MNAANRKNSLSRRSNRGQGMTEYIIIVSLIAIASIGIVTLFGDNIRRLFGMASDSLTGDSEIANRNTQKATGQLQAKTLKNAHQNNAY